MSIYWFTFRLAENPTYSKRYDALIEGINSIASNWWVESSSFLLFDSAQTIDGIAAMVKKSVSESVDIVLIGMTEMKSARIIGPINDQDLFALMPFTKRA